jgi:putative hydrolase of the HAD superfamily
MTMLSSTPQKRSPEGNKLHVRCVLFDLDGTLYDSPEYSDRLETEIVRFVSERVALSESDTKELLNQRRKQLGTLTRTIQSLGIDRNAFFDAMAARIEPSHHIPVDPIVHSVLEMLRQRGFRVGLVSNSGRPLVRKILAAIGLEEDLFDVIVTSTEAEPKPSPQPFQLATEKLACAVEEIVYVGDREEAEIRPARHFGLKTILLNRAGATQGTSADLVIGNLSEVLSMLEAG